MTRPLFFLARSLPFVAIAQNYTAQKMSGGGIDFIRFSDDFRSHDLRRPAEESPRGGQARRRAATLEFVPDEDRVSAPMPAAFAMVMLASTTSGDADTLSELTGMYHEAGFAGINGHPRPMSPHTIVMGRA
jgi:hypothetical protein